ncbi:3-deoxy-7-phosphoheptulonate synthase [Stutzerimonas kirkiae]|uniref:Phospho-2-dehydro-3-deoxyheptonate aldolase n=1 Tax=Stutzerimonas kirkiae TaxID=2211392 RepID=A0A4Q9R212_9GAMM|nr:3-deoxy-7-phosphoheptulonate synthase [Stutzerimonas kirkiae]TBU93303.1 3-deoxy-7-phosphoheptulonate synthase [Stutzerimonas kirkiae]TBV01437.1 3-deoxy-7-phosphoheptulonate synthase [Stutzerimonas kirkiae]
MNAVSAPLPQCPSSAEDRRVSQPLATPTELRQRLAPSITSVRRVHEARDAARAIIRGDDPRLLVVIGPCSLHDRDSALEYAGRLARLAGRVEDEMLLVMRAYVEKPRTTIGWKGLLYDPHLDGSGDMAEGLALSRRLMLDMLDCGLPLASELLNPLAAGYFDDLLSWAAIGARTSESQVHREMVSGLALPVGFKNGTDGSVGIACDAMRSAAHPHRHLGVDDHGRPALIEAAGNLDTHLVLRGGQRGPNHDAASVTEALARMRKQGIEAGIMVDCSHANSGKDPSRQPLVFESVLQQRLEGQNALRAVMLESHLFDGCQPLSGQLRYGVSITDGCLGWDASECLLLDAARRLRQS